MLGPACFPPLRTRRRPRLFLHRGRGLTSSGVVPNGKSHLDACRPGNWTCRDNVGSISNKRRNLDQTRKRRRPLDATACSILWQRRWSHSERRELVFQFCVAVSALIVHLLIGQSSGECCIIIGHRLYDIFRSPCGYDCRRMTGL